ncbi:hypothetical protein [Leisingera sp. ANG59]|uniref:hypothetical protein n=1 Tax=Leisingera sp. ANG59 TaxID=2675221 RepID=UPI00157478F2|nr:hypothetical protein [Leisingera sp. ANG59]NSY38277.1 hypothetical protein [Leisingera sp. ANG59]
MTHTPCLLIIRMGEALGRNGACCGAALAERCAECGRLNRRLTGAFVAKASAHKPLIYLTGAVNFRKNLFKTRKNATCFVRRKILGFRWFYGFSGPAGNFAAQLRRK